MVQAFGDGRPAVLARELTKLFETVLDGNLAQLQARVESDGDQRKGEFVVLVQGAGEDADAKVIEGRRLYARLKDHLPPSTAAKLAAELSGAPRKELYGSDERHRDGSDAGLPRAAAPLARARRNARLFVIGARRQARGFGAT